MADLEQVLHDVAKNPRKAKGDSSSMETHPLDKIIDAIRFTSSSTAVDTNNKRGMRFSKFLPPGAIE